MSLIPWRPFGDLSKFFEDDEWFLPVVSKFQLNAPAMDVYETEKEVVVEANLPGFDPQNIDVEVTNGVLRVSGTMEEKSEEKKKEYWRREIRKGSFERSVRLPAPVDEEKVDASYEKGVLKIVMPKMAQPRGGKKITIKSHGA